MTVRFVKTNGNCEQFKVLGNYKVTYVSDDKWFVTSARNRMITVYYWATRVDYRSCSVCDTFQSYSDSCNPENSAPEMVTMALHMIEEMKQIF